MTATSKELGRLGEQLAAERLEAQGWTVLERNWRCRYGEMDIVAMDGRVLVFCEVKTRRSQRFGTAVEAVTPAKVARLRKLACVWLDGRRSEMTHLGGVRIDVIAVTVSPGRVPDLVHLKAVA